MTPEEFVAILKSKEGDEASNRAIWERLALPINGWDRLYDAIDEPQINQVTASDGTAFTVITLFVYNGPARLVVFRKPKNRDAWTPVGVLDTEHQRYYAPKHRIYSASNRHWIVTEFMSAGGTGVFAAWKSWYAIGDRGLDPVLSYPSDGHEDPSWIGLRRSESHSIGALNFFGKSDSWEVGPGREVEVAESLQLDRGIPIVKVRFLAKFLGFITDSSEVMFSRSDELTYARDPASGRFVVDRSRSTASAADGDAIYGIGNDGLRYDNILKLTFSNLKTLARSKDDTQRRWLRRLLEMCPGSSEKTQLEELLKPQ